MIAVQKIFKIRIDVITCRISALKGKVFDLLFTFVFAERNDSGQRMQASQTLGNLLLGRIRLIVLLPWRGMPVVIIT